MLEFFWPRGGWGRAARYVKHRLHRLPDPPHRIARGIFAGVFSTFTPFYGLHFVCAGLIALIMRGNILAALLSTFFGNPVTYVPIGAAAMSTGYWLLGLENTGEHGGLTHKFVKASEDLWDNLIAIFRGSDADWTDLTIFYNEVFFPYLIGGILPGLLAATVCYYISLPLVTAYQNRRRGALKARIATLRKKKADNGAE